jgi:5-methyltetrahydrofolate--homocysteine methyltransferase
VSADKYLSAAQEHKANLIGLSALLTTTMPAMKETVRLLKAANLPNVKIMVGGAPITQAFADEIGADGYSADAGSAVEVARKLMGEAA